MTKAAFSLDAFDAATASDKPIEMEIILPDGSNSGAFLLVLGNESPKVQAEVNRLVNERRKKALRAEAVRVKGDAAFTPIEEDIEFGHRLTAVRVVGWRGIKEEWSPENAYRLVSRNASIATQVTQASGEVADFLRNSSAA